MFIERWESKWMHSASGFVTSNFDDFVMAYLFLKNEVDLRLAQEFVDLRYQIQVNMCTCAMHAFEHFVIKS